MIDLKQELEAISAVFAEAETEMAVTCANLEAQDAELEAAISAFKALGAAQSCAATAAEMKGDNDAY